MKTPVFRLQSVLDYRAAAVEEAQRRLHAALVELEEARAKVRAAREYADMVAGQMCQLSGPTLAGAQQRQRDAYRAQVRLIDQLQMEADLRLQKVHQLREKLVQAKKEHDILLRLRGKWLQAVRTDLQRKEEKSINDIINTRFFQTHIQPALHPQPM